MSDKDIPVYNDVQLLIKEQTRRILVAIAEEGRQPTAKEMVFIEKIVPLFSEMLHLMVTDPNLTDLPFAIALIPAIFTKNADGTPNRCIHLVSGAHHGDDAIAAILRIAAREVHRCDFQEELQKAKDILRQFGFNLEALPACRKPDGIQ